jgi:hypothetical protein
MTKNTAAEVSFTLKDFIVKSYFPALSHLRHRRNLPPVAADAQSSGLLGVYRQIGRHPGEAVLPPDRQDRQLHALPDSHQRLRLLRHLRVGRGRDEHLRVRWRGQCVHKVSLC